MLRCACVRILAGHGRLHSEHLFAQRFCTQSKAGTDASAEKPPDAESARAPDRDSAKAEPTAKKDKKASTHRWRLVEAEDLGVIDKHAGKVEHALAGRFLSSANAPAWPQLDVFEQGAKETTICQRPAPPARAMVVLACYRSSGQALLQPWRNRIIKALQGSPAVDLVELNLIDISVCRLWPISRMIVNAAKPAVASCDGISMPVRHLYFFGDVQIPTETLGMANRLSGYVFVVDAAGGIRWRESGRMVGDDDTKLLDAVRVVAGLPKA